MRDEQCPKCGAREVHLMDEPYADMGSVSLSWTGKAKTSYYICARCGYLEIYLRDESVLPKTAQKWLKVQLWNYYYEGVPYKEALRRAEVIEDRLNSGRGDIYEQVK